MGTRGRKTKKSVKIGDVARNSRTLMNCTCSPSSVLNIYILHQEQRTANNKMFSIGNKKFKCILNWRIAID